MGFFRRNTEQAESEWPEDDGEWQGAAPGFYFDASHASIEWYNSIIRRICMRRENAVVNTRGGYLEIYAHGRFIDRTSDGTEAERIYDSAVTR